MLVREVRCPVMVSEKRVPPTLIYSSSLSPQTSSYRLVRSRLKRISPFNNDLCVFADEIVLGEDEEGSGVGPSHPWKTQIGCSFGDIPERILCAPAPVGTVGAEVRHPGKRFHVLVNDSHRHNPTIHYPSNPLLSIKSWWELLAASCSSSSIIRLLSTW